MAISVRAIYQNGVLRPLEKLDLPEQQEVNITIQASSIDEDLLAKLTQNLQGKDLDQLVGEAKRDSEDRILGQGIAHIALLISDLLMKAVEASEKPSTATATAQKVRTA